MELLTEDCSAFCEVDTGDLTMRAFVEDVCEEELKWIRDRLHSIHLKVVGGRDWKLQLEHDSPMTLEIGKEYFIPRDMFYRIIKGKNNLILEMTKR